MTDITVGAWAAAQLASWRREMSMPAAPGDSRVADWMDSGAVALTGRSDGPALVPPGAAATAALGAEAAFAELSGDSFAHRWHRLLAARAALVGARRRAPWSVGGACRAVRCLDGWVTVSLARPDDIATVPAVVEDDVTPAGSADAWCLLDDWAAGIPAEVATERMRLLGLPAGSVPAAGSWWPCPVAHLGLPSSPVIRLDVAESAPRTSPPLVVDLSALWAGPLCSHLLGLAGATVVKVEIAGRLDGARRGDEAFYDVLHAGHDAVLIDLDAAADRQLLHRLLAKADVVIEASRPRALRAWGIAAEEMCDRSPTTWVSITAYGRQFDDRVGFGDDVAMAAGLAAREPGDDRPVPCADAIADPLTGMHAAVHALASHLAGGSRILDVAMAGVVASTVAWSPGEATPAETAPAPRSPERGAPAAPPGRDTEKWRVAS